MPDDDEALIAAALAGSAPAWEKLVRRHEGRVYNQGLRLMGNGADAMDLVQEVFLGVYRNLHRFRGDAKFSSWLFRIVHNKAVDLSRRRRLLAPGPVASTGGAEPDALPAEPEAGPEHQLGRSRENRRIMRLLGTLPMETRLVVELKMFQSRTFDEIAVIQDISANTAKTRFYSALRKLKTLMEKENALS